MQLILEQAPENVQMKVVSCQNKPQSRDLLTSLRHLCLTAQAAAQYPFVGAQILVTPQAGRCWAKTTCNTHSILIGWTPIA